MLLAHAADVLVVLPGTLVGMTAFRISMRTYVFEALARHMEPLLLGPEVSRRKRPSSATSAIALVSGHSFLIFLYVYSLGIACLVYFVEISSIYLPIDGENTDNYFQTLSLGRWFHAVLRATILPEPFLPYFTTLVGLAAIALSAIIAARFLRLSSGRALAFCTLFVSFPNLAYQFEFINQSDTVSIGYALAVISGVLLWRAYELPSFLHGLALGLCAAAALALAVGAYQSLITVPIILIAGRWIIEEQRSAPPALLRVLIGGAIFLIIAIAIYAVVSHLFQRHYGILTAQNYYAGYLTTTSDLHARIKSSLELLHAIITGAVNYGFVTYFLAALATLALLLRAIRTRRPFMIVSIIATVAILLLPFAFAFLVGGPLPPRIYVSANLSLAVLMTLCFQRSSVSILLTITGVIAVVHTSLVSALFYSDIRVRNSDVLMANRIEAFVETKFGNRIGPTTPVYFHGGVPNQIEKKLPASDIFGSSFFFWDGGNTLRIIGLMDYYGIARYRMITRDDFLKIKPRLATLPKWPDPDSAQLIEGVLVIKLGDASGWLPFPVD